MTVLDNEKILSDPEEVFNRCLSAYNQKNFGIIDAFWRALTPDKRLKIFFMAYKDGNMHFFTKAHFEVHKNDIDVLQKAKEEYANSLGLSTEQVKVLFRGFKDKRFIRDDNNKITELDQIDRTIIKLVELCNRLKEYDELANEYPDFKRAIAVNGFSIMKCDPRRTKSRIKFLLEVNNGQIPNEFQFAKDLSAFTPDFNLKYQKEMEQKFSTIRRDNGDYSKLVSMVNEGSDFAYDKFCEFALRAVYGDKELLNLIETRSEERAKAKAAMQVAKASKPVSLADEEDVIKVNELFDDAMPADKHDRGQSNHTSSSNSKPNNIEVLKEKNVQKFLSELSALGIECEGTVASEGGTKALDESKLIYYVLKKENYLILEPIGQVGNATYILSLTKTMEEAEKIKETEGLKAPKESIETDESKVILAVKKLLRQNTRKELVQKGFATSLNHKRTSEQAYNYAAIKIKNIITIIEEFSRDKATTLNLADLKKQVTKLIPKAEVPEASTYISELDNKTRKERGYGLIKLAQWVDEIESQAAKKEPRIKKRNYEKRSYKSLENDIASENGKSVSQNGEVDF